MKQCEIHHTPMFMVAGQYFCPHCLERPIDKPVQYEQTAKLTGLPSKLQSCRLNLLDKKQDGKPYRLIVNLNQLFCEDDEFKNVSNNGFWFFGEKTSEIIAAVYNERRIKGLSASYLNVQNFICKEQNEQSSLLTDFTQAKVMLLDGVISKGLDNLASYQYSLLFSRLFEEIRIENKKLLIASSISMSQMIKITPRLQTLFKNTENIFEMKSPF